MNQRMNRRMNQRDESQLAEVIGAAYDYYRQGLSDSTLNLWLEAMRPYELADVRRAISAHMQDPDRGNFPVGISDVTKLLVGRASEHAHTAWHKVMTAIRLCGNTHDVVFDDLAIHAVIDGLGGWVKLCSSSTEELGSYTQAAFVKAYVAMRATGVPPDTQRLLRGTRAPDDDFLSRGLEVPLPVLIGDEHRALQLLPAETQQQWLAMTTTKRIAA